MNSEILLYQTEDGLTKIEVALENETVWLTQRMSSLYLSRKRIFATDYTNFTD